MPKSIIIILIGNRKDSAVQVQKIMTAWGCQIKTRLGIHDGVLDNCSDEGLIFLELVGKPEDHAEFARKLNLVKHVKAQLINLSLAED